MARGGLAEPPPKLNPKTPPDISLLRAKMVLTMGPQLIAGENGQMDKNGLDNGSTIGYSSMVWYGKPKRKFRQPIYGGKSMKLSMAVLTMVSAAVMASGAGIGFRSCPAVGADTAGCEMLVDRKSVG